MNPARTVRQDRRRPDWIGWVGLAAILGILAWITVVSMQNSHRDAKLVNAVQRGDVDAVHLQLARNHYSRRTLGLALYTCVMNPGKHNPQIFAMLLEHGADPNSGLPEFSALEAAIQGDEDWAVRALLARGANPNRHGEFYGSMLAMAVQMNRVKAAEMLLDNGAKPDSMDLQKNSVLYLALQRRQFTIVRRLVSKGVNLNASCGLLRETPLIVAITQGEVEAANLFIEHGANVEAVDTMNMTALFCAVDGGQSAILKALIAHGADVNRKVNNVFPLAEAYARYNQVEVTMLLKAGAHR